MRKYISNKHESNNASDELVSVIVPVYNTPFTLLSRCLKSIVTQAYRNMEVLIVDDGSADAYKKEIAEACSVDARIKLLMAGHGGVSYARNMALREAKGSWVCFVDADDEITHGFIDEAMAIAKATGSDYVQGVTAWLRDGGFGQVDSRDNSVTVLEGNDEIANFSSSILSRLPLRNIAYPKIVGRTLGAKLFSREHIPTRLFPEDVAIGEDAIFICDFLSNCKTVAVVNSTWYLYYLYASSASHGAPASTWLSSFEGLVRYGELSDNSEDARAGVASLAIQAMDSMVATDLYNGLSEAKLLLEYATREGCYAANIYAAYSLTPIRRIFNRLCRAKLYGMAFALRVVRYYVKCGLKRVKS